MIERTQTGPLIRASDTSDDAYDAVETALTRTSDARAGFETMVDKAEPSFRPVAQRFLDLHTRHAALLSALLSDAGRAPDTDGSLMGTVNRAVVATRAFFDRIDDDVVRQIVQGEQSVVSAYGEALDSDLPAAERDILSGLLAELQTLVAETRARA